MDRGERRGGCFDRGRQLISLEHVQSGNGPIFIGGTGRSGTAILAQALGTHPDVWTVPAESRLLVDPDGLLNLLDALSIRYSPPTAHSALVRFVDFALVDLTTQREGPYRELNLAAVVGESHYRQTIEAFVESLILAKYAVQVDYWTESAGITRARNAVRLASGFSRDALLEGPRLLVSSPRSFFSPRRWERLARERAGMAAWDAPSTVLATQRSKLSPRWHRPYPVRGLQRYIARYCEREPLVRAAADMVDALFSYPMTAAGKRLWCEKTPMNVLFLPALAELFPDAVFVHIKRDPRGVAWSLAGQRFGPSSLDQAAVYLREVYRAWLATTFRPRNYFEIKLEDLALDPLGTLGPIVTACELGSEWEHLPTMELATVTRWQSEMEGCARDRVEEVLGSLISRMGYDQGL